MSDDRELQRAVEAALKPRGREPLLSGTLFLAELDALDELRTDFGEAASAAVFERCEAAFARRLPPGAIAGRLLGSQLAAYVPGLPHEAAEPLAEELRRAVERVRFSLPETRALIWIEDKAASLSLRAFSATVGFGRSVPWHYDLEHVRFPAHDALRRARREGPNRVGIPRRPVCAVAPPLKPTPSGDVPTLSETLAFGWNLPHRWYEGWDRGTGELPLEGEREPLVVSFEHRGLDHSAQGFDVRFSFAGKPLLVNEKFTTAHTGNSGTYTSHVESEGQPSGCATGLVQAIRRRKEQALPFVRSGSRYRLDLDGGMTSGAVYNTVVYVHARSTLTVDLSLGLVSIEHRESVDTST